MWGLYNGTNKQISVGEIEPRWPNIKEYDKKGPNNE